MSDLMTPGSYRLHCLRKGLGRVSRSEKCRRDRVALEQVQHPPDPDPASEFTSGENSRSGAVEHVHPRGHGVEVEGQADRTWQWRSLGSHPSAPWLGLRQHLGPAWVAQPSSPQYPPQPDRRERSKVSSVTILSVIARVVRCRVRSAVRRCGRIVSSISQALSLGLSLAAGACREGESGGWLRDSLVAYTRYRVHGEPLPPTRPLHARRARLNQALGVLLAATFTLPYISCSVASTNGECTT
jgi:hypothetical protein